MALVPYSVTALAESDAEGTSGKNIIAGAIVEFYNAETGGSAQTLYDDAASANPSTTKATDAQGQVTVFVEQGLWWLTINGGTRRAVTIDNSTSVVAAIEGQDITPDAITGLSTLNTVTAVELTQIANIDATTISAAQWAYLGNANQDTTSGSTVTFVGLFVDSIATLGQSGAFNGILNTPESMYINIDSDNSQTGSELVVGTNRAGNSGGAALLTIRDDKSIDAPGVVTLGQSGALNGTLNTTESMYLNIDSDNSQTGSEFVIGTNRVGSSGGTALIAFKDDGTVNPGADNTQDFGSASFRWAEFFAGNGTINTSDETLKTEFTALRDDEKAAFLAIKDSIGSYKWLDAIDKKGDLARVHIGIGAQSAIAEFTNRGLDWTKYSCFCLDDIEVYETQKVTESQQVTVTKTREKTSVEMVGGVPVLTKIEDSYEDPQFDTVGVIDENGEPVMVETVTGKDEEGEEIKELVQMTHNVPIMGDVEVEKPVLVPAGQRYGIRYNELIMGILASN